MLCGLLEVEEHAAPEHAETRWTTESGDNVLYRRITSIELVSYNGENGDKDGSERESAWERCRIWKETETHSTKYIA